jgi:glycosyltransferase involved in cell wall biosynthesis
MRILYIISSIDKNCGGPSFSLINFIEELSSNNNIEIHLLCNKSSNPVLSSSDINNFFIHFTNNYYFFFKLILLQKKNKFNLIHVHGLYNLSTLIAALSTYIFNFKFIISPRGALQPWALTQKKFQKLFFLFFFKIFFGKKITYFHSTSQSEYESIYKVFKKNRIILIPNGFNNIKFNYSYTYNKPKNIALFLSRIHKSKGIEDLIISWKKLNPQHKLKWDLYIVGDGNSDYLTKIKQLIKNDISIKLFNGVYDESKFKFMYEADLFILPSYSENFGNVVAESLLCCTPVLTTNNTPWNILETYDCGWYIDLSNLYTTLNYILSLDNIILSNYGKNGRNYIIENYNLKHITQKFNQIYLNILQ